MLFKNKLEILKNTLLLFLLSSINTANTAEQITTQKPLECRISIKAIKPAPSSVIKLGESVHVEVDYSFNNVPSGIEIIIFPGIISSEADFQNFLPVTGIPLVGDNTLLQDVFEPAKPVINGKLHFSYLNQGNNIGSFDSLIATLRFSRLANNDDLIGAIGSDIKPGTTLLPIASKDITCKTDTTSPVNWVFSDKSH